MSLMQPKDLRYRHLQSNVAPQISISRRGNVLMREGQCRMFSFKKDALQRSPVMVISMTISCAHFTSGVQSSGSRLWFKVFSDVKQRLVIKGKFQASSGSFWQYFECANALHRGISSVIQGKLSEAFVFCINCVVSPSLVLSVCVPSLWFNLATPLLLALVSLVSQCPLLCLSK